MEICWGLEGHCMNLVSLKQTPGAGPCTGAEPLGKHELLRPCWSFLSLPVNHLIGAMVLLEGWLAGATVATC